jgi:carbonic anhydrase
MSLLQKQTTDSSLQAVNTAADIPAKYQNTPIGRLLEFHNLGVALDKYERAELLIGMCMDNRKILRTPDNFAYILRTSGANMRHNEFRVSFALSIGGVRHIALIAHTNCGMVGLTRKMPAFVQGMIEVGWDEQEAKDYFFQYAPFFEIENETDFVRLEAARLREKYPNVVIAPLLYQLEDNRLYIVEDNQSHVVQD